MDVAAGSTAIRLQPPDEAVRTIGGRVDAVELRDTLRHRWIVDRRNETRDVDLRELELSSHMRETSGRSDAHLMSRLRDFLHDNAAAEIPIEALAQLAGSSSWYVVRRFRPFVALPPSAYQLQVRLERSKVLLRTGTSISVTALTLGFADQAHFSRAFKRMFAVTPGRISDAVARQLRQASLTPAGQLIGRYSGDRSSSWKVPTYGIRSGRIDTRASLTTFRPNPDN